MEGPVLLLAYVIVRQDLRDIVVREASVRSLAETEESVYRRTPAAVSQGIMGPGANSVSVWYRASTEDNAGVSTGADVKPVTRAITVRFCHMTKELVGTTQIGNPVCRKTAECSRGAGSSTVV